MQPRIFPTILVFLTAILVYYSSITFDFAYDDVLQITQNPQVISRKIDTAFIGTDFLSPTPPGNLYRPITTFTYKMNWFASHEPYLFHLVNVILFAIISILVFKFFCKLTKSEAISFTIALIFVAHPLHVEAVANIIGRAELLSAFFGLLSLLWFIKAPQITSVPKMVFYATISACFFFLAMLSKESSITLLPLIPIAAYLILNNQLPNNRERALRIFPGCTMLLGSVALALLLRAYVLKENTLFNVGSQIWVENPIAHLSFIDRIVPGLFLLSLYIQKLILPLDLSADYSVTPQVFFSELYSLKGMLLFVLLVSIVFLVYRSKSILVKFLFLWTILTFSLTLNIFFPIGTIMGDRLSFLPSIGFIGCFTLLICEHAKSSLIKSWVLSLYIAILTVTTASRVPIWQDNTTLFNRTILDRPQSPKANYNACVERYLNESNLHEAELYCRNAVELFPDYVLPIRLLSEIALKNKQFGSLEYWYRRLLVLTPDDKEVKDNLDKLLKWKNETTTH